MSPGTWGASDWSILVENRQFHRDLRADAESELPFNCLPIQQSSAHCHLQHARRMAAGRRRGSRTRKADARCETRRPLAASLRQLVETYVDEDVLLRSENGFASAHRPCDFVVSRAHPFAAVA